jgi:hypothetical protein
LIVDDRRDGVTVVEKTGRSEVKYVGTLNGTPSEERKPNSVYVRTLRRDNGALLWQVKMTRLADQTSIAYSDRWTLSPDGKTLTVLRVYPGPRQVLRVFVRKE